jgi:hypothetical protein
MKKIFLTVFLILFSISINAQQLSGVYVLSEGGFSAGTSMLSKLDASNNEFTKSIFNPGDIGLYPDGLIIEEGIIYLVEQGSFGGPGKIYKLDQNGTVIDSKEVGTNTFPSYEIISCG